jgi:hypothetical protein
MFGKPTVSEATEYQTPFWDQRLYERHFSQEPSELEKIHGRYFSCVLSKCKTTLQLGAKPLERYFGQMKWLVGPMEYCVVTVQVELASPTDPFENSMSEVVFGYMYFLWHVDSTQRPSIHIKVRDDSGTAEQLRRLFWHVKSSGGGGVEVAWCAKLQAMLGTAAKKAWGDWEKDSPRDENGVLVPGKFPGQHAFHLESVEFNAEA